MNYISLLFFVLLALVVLFYYVLPKKAQWIVLLAGSLIFYAYASYIALPVLILETLAIFFLVKKMEKSSRKKGFAFAAIALLVLVLILLMYVPALWKSSFFTGGIVSKLIAPLGISYYTLMMISYVVDTYRETIPAERNFAKLLLFALYFPSITQGPMNRYGDLAPQFIKEHSFDSKRAFLGLMRFAYGAFKKLVVANRVAAFISAVNSNQKAAGVFILMDLILFMLQLYSDFSGCADMAIGMSQILGINLPENFHHPYLSRSISEYWRRWHLTLGSWLKDYIYYPLSMSPLAKKYIKSGKGSKKMRIKLVSSIAFFILWMVMGIWHGTGIMFVFMGLQYAIVFIATYLLEPVSKKFAKNHPKLEANGLWKFWQQLRTIFLLWPIFLNVSSPKALGNFVTRIFTSFHAEKLFDGGLLKFDLSALQWILLLIGFLTILIVSNIEERKGEHIFEIVLRQKLWIRILIYWFVVIMILLSLSVQNTEFIYAQY